MVALMLPSITSSGFTTGHKSAIKLWYVISTGALRSTKQKKFRVFLFHLLTKNKQVVGRKKSSYNFIQSFVAARHATTIKMQRVTSYVACSIEQTVYKLRR